MAYDINKDKNPTCVNILKLQRYNFKFFSLEEVVFFEYLIVKAKAFKFKQFYYSTQRILEETGIKRTKLNAIITKFNTLGILDVEVKGFPPVKHFTVDFEQIYNLLPDIYQFVEIDKSHADFYKSLDVFYKSLVETYQKKNSTISIDNKNIEKEKLDIEKESDFFLKKFENFLHELKMEFELHDNQLKYNDHDIVNLFNNYDEQIIFQKLREFFELNTNSKISEFLKFDKLNLHKNTFIEKTLFEEKKAAQNLLKVLENVFNDRRESKSTAKRKFTKTALPINNTIINKVIKVLKVKGQQEIRNAFIAFTDDIITGEVHPSKILPYFFVEKDGEYNVLDNYLDNFNVNYDIRSN